jgi:hypothetical protein
MHTKLPITIVSKLGGFYLLRLRAIAWDSVGVSPVIERTVML